MYKTTSHHGNIYIHTHTHTHTPHKINTISLYTQFFHLSKPCKSPSEAENYTKVKETDFLQSPRGNILFMEGFKALQSMGLQRVGHN